MSYNQKNKHIHATISNFSFQTLRTGQISRLYMMPFQNDANYAMGPCSIL